MQVKPILFSAPMIRAILREIERPGTGKTQTRRRLKIKGHKTFSDFGPSDTAGYDWHFRDDCKLWHDIRAAELRPRLAYSVGDLLWVRETWCYGPIGRDGVVEDWSNYIYRATSPEVEGVDDGDGYAELNADGSIKSCWKPSIHMPRKASRLTLEVTGVRVERLQDMEGQHPSESDAIAEGVRAIHHGDGEYYYSAFRDQPDPKNWCDPTDAFRELWNTINGPGSWEANPWVVAVSFKPHLINVDAFLAQQVAA